MPETQIKPRLVSHKQSRRAFGSINPVTDLPISGDFFHDQSQNADRLISSRSVLCGQIRETHKYKLFASTWNVAGIPPPDNLNLEDWLDIDNVNSYDIYVLGFQEVIPLNAKNVLGPEKNGNSIKWNSLIGEALNKSIVTGSQKGFQCLISKQMVGIMVSVWVRDHLLPFIQHQSVSCVGCGIMGCLRNKGSVSVRFSLHETSFCILCCHLASGSKEGSQALRNSNAMEIFSRTRFSSSPSSLHLPRKIFDHERIILLGDLNYRISLPEEDTRPLVLQKEWDILLQKDQLKAEITEGGAFEGWHEGAINFSPTYKYYQNSDEYYGSQYRKGDKRRAPAWCDRILWHGNGLKQTGYGRYESKHSDHRPVRATFYVEVDRISTNSTLEALWIDRIQL